MNNPLKDVAEAFELDLLPQEEQQEVLAEVHTAVYKGALMKLIERMDEPTREEFAALLATDPSEEDALAFFTEKVPDADLAIKEAVTDVLSDILAGQQGTV